MKKLLVLLAMMHLWTSAAPLPQPNKDEFGILLATTGYVPFNMPLFGFSVAGSPFNQSFTYSASHSQLDLIPGNNGYYIGLTYNAVKNWDGVFVYEFDTTDDGKVHKTGQIDKKYIKGGGLIRIIFTRKLNNDKYQYDYKIQDLTNAK